MKKEFTKALRAVVTHKTFCVYLNLNGVNQADQFYAMETLTRFGKHLRTLTLDIKLDKQTINAIETLAKDCPTLETLIINDETFTLSATEAQQHTPKLNH